MKKSNVKWYLLMVIPIALCLFFVVCLHQKLPSQVRENNKYSQTEICDFIKRDRKIPLLITKRLAKICNIKGNEKN